MADKLRREAFSRKKWGILYDYVNTKRNGILSYEEVMAFPNRLIASGKTADGRRLESCYNTLWKSICESNSLPVGSATLTRDEWIQGMERVKLSQFFKETFVPTVSALYFDVIDTDHDDSISLKEWRAFQNDRGNHVESSILEMFEKLDKDGDGMVSRDEIRYAFTQFGLNDDPAEDFSFIYKLY